MSIRLLLGTSSAAFGLATLVVGSAAQGPAPSGSGVIVAQRCRVILADEAVLASDRPGILKFVEPEEGAQVSKGQKVAALNDEVAAAAVKVAEETAKNDIEIRYAQKSAEVSDAEYRKALQANKRTAGSLPEVEVERMRLSVERAKLQIEKAALDQSIARLTVDEKVAELATYQVICPLDGVVTRVMKHDGEAVQQGDPILQVVRTDTVRVEGFVNVADVFRVKAGDPVRVRLDLPEAAREVTERTFEGKIGFVDVTANPVSKQVRVWATVPNDGNLLRAGLPAAMEIVPTGEIAATEGRE